MKLKKKIILYATTRNTVPHGELGENQSVVGKRGITLRTAAWYIDFEFVVRPAVRSYRVVPWDVRSRETIREQQCRWRRDPVRQSRYYYRRDGCQTRAYCVVVAATNSERF